MWLGFFVLSIPAFLGEACLGWGGAGGDSTGELAARPPRRRSRPGSGHLGPVGGCWSRGGGAGRAVLWPRAWAGMRASSPAPGLGTARGSSTEDRRRGDPDSELSNRLLWPKVGGGQWRNRGGGSNCDSAGLPGLLFRRLFHSAYL